MSLKTTKVINKTEELKTSKTKVLIKSRKISGLKTQVIRTKHGYAQRIKTTDIFTLKNKYDYRNKKRKILVQKFDEVSKNKLRNNLNSPKLPNINKVARDVKKKARKVKTVYKIQNSNIEEMQTKVITRRLSHTTNKLTSKATNKFLNKFPFILKLKMVIKKIRNQLIKMLLMYLLPLVLVVCLVYIPIIGAVSSVVSIFASGDKTTAERYDNYIANRNEYWDLKLEIAISDNPGLEIIQNGYYINKNHSSIDWRSLLSITQAYFITEGISGVEKEFALLNEFSTNGLMQIITITDTAIIVITPSFEEVINYMLDTRGAEGLDEGFIELARMLYESENLFDNLDKINIRNLGIGAFTISAEGFKIRIQEPVKSDRRWYSNDSPFYRMVDERGHYLVNECTWYAYGRGSEILGVSNFEEILGTGHFIRDAGRWFSDNATMQRTGSGFNSSTNINEPKRGAIFVLSIDGEPGHVGIIEQVNTDGTVNISHSGANIKFQYIENIRLDTYFSRYNFVGYIYLLN